MIFFFLTRARGSGGMRRTNRFDRTAHAVQYEHHNDEAVLENTLAINDV